MFTIYISSLNRISRLSFAALEALLWHFTSENAYTHGTRHTSFLILPCLVHILTVPSQLQVSSDSLVDTQQLTRRLCLFINASLYDRKNSNTKISHEMSKLLQLQWNRACQWVSHNVLFWNSQVYWVNDSIYKILTEYFWKFQLKNALWECC